MDDDYSYLNEVEQEIEKPEKTKKKNVISKKRKFSQKPSTSIDEEPIPDARDETLDISNIPLRLLREGKIPVKIDKKKRPSVETAESTAPPPPKKLHRSRPKVASSKIPVSSFREVYVEKKKKKWDPRFDNRAGELNAHLFDKNYEFLDEVRKEEKLELQRELADTAEVGDQKRMAKISRKLDQYVSRENAAKERKIREEAMNEIREENIERMLRGERPQFKTKAEVKKKVLEKKFNSLRSENKLNKYIEKKTKKQGQKEKRKSRRDVEKLTGVDARINNFNSTYGYQ